MSREFSRFNPDDVLDHMRSDVVAGSTDAKRRVATRLASSIAGLGPDVEGHEGDDPASEPNLADRFEPPSLALSAARPVAQLANRLGAVMRRPVLWSLATFSVGAACGAGIHAAITRHANAPSVTTTGRASAAETLPRRDGRADQGVALAPTDPKNTGVPGAALGVPEFAPAEAPAVPASRARASGHPMAGLAEQQALLDEARSALARGDDGAALRAVELHARRFPDSVMIEEREALAIKALVGKEKFSEARSRGERFRARFPRSLLLSSLEETLATIP